MFTRLAVVLVLFLLQDHVLGGEVKYSRYELPPLYSFDDYDACFVNGTSELASTYCMVYAEIQANDSVELWHKIETHNAYRFNYKNDRLYFGLCLSRCMRFANGSPANDNFTLNNEITQYFEMVHKYPLDLEMRSSYSQMIRECLNEEFERKYHLKLNTFVEYCERRPEQVNLKEKDK